MGTEGSPQAVPGRVRDMNMRPTSRPRQRLSRVCALHSALKESLNTVVDFVYFPSSGASSCRVSTSFGGDDLAGFSQVEAWDLRLASSRRA